MSNEARTQVEKILSNVGVKFTAIYRGVRRPFDGKTEMDSWDCWLEPTSGEPYMFDFYTGLGHRKARPTSFHRATWRTDPKPQAPHPATVLHCLLSDADGVANARGFEDWCADYGYGSDSRKAYRTYEACGEVDRHMRRVFAPEALEALREALQDY